jgi:hypothetical protein
VTAPPVPNYGSLTPGASTSTAGGTALNIWNLPSYIVNYEKTTKKPFWWNTTENQIPAGISGNQSEQQAAEHGVQVPNQIETANQYHSAEEIMQQFAAMAQDDPAQFAAIRQLLQAGGFYGASKTIQGGFSAQTEKAVADAMTQYLKGVRNTATPQNFFQFLSQQAADNVGIGGPGSTAGGGSSTTGGGTLPNRPTLTDPDTLYRYGEEAAQAELGQNLPQGQLAQFVNEFHQQQAAGEEGALGHQGAFVDKSDPRGSAVVFVQNADPMLYQQHEVQGYADSFLNMLGLPGSSQAPNMPIDPSGAQVSY